MEKLSPFEMTMKDKIMLRLLADQAKLLINAALVLRESAQIHEEIAAKMREMENNCLRMAKEPDV